MATGKRELGFLPCQRPKSELKKVECQRADPQVTTAKKPALVVRDPVRDQRKSR